MTPRTDLERHRQMVEDLLRRADATRRRAAARVEPTPDGVHDATAQFDRLVAMRALNHALAAGVRRNGIGVPTFTPGDGIRRHTNHPYVLDGLCAGAVWADDEPADAWEALRAIYTWPNPFLPRQDPPWMRHHPGDPERMLPDIVLHDRGTRPLQFPGPSYHYVPLDHGVPIPHVPIRIGSPWLSMIPDHKAFDTGLRAGIALPPDPTPPRDWSALVAIVAAVIVVAVVVGVCWLAVNP